MVQVIQASNLSLHDLETRFALQRVQERQFFPEWRGELPALTDCARIWLDSIKTDFLGLARHPPHEEVVKMVVLSPLLSIAGFYRDAFLPVAEKHVELAFEAGDETIRGRVDLLVLHQQLCAIAIESKRKGLDVLEALPQALFYMLTNPQAADPTFGLATNGHHFVFLKLVKQATPHYALSNLFSLINDGNDLYTVAGILKRLATQVSETV